MLYIVNVAHTEPNWWDGTYSGLDIGAQRFLDDLAAASLRVPITWCAYFGNGHLIPGTGQEAPDLLLARPAFVAERYQLGDELGIHVHGQRIFSTEPFIAPNARQLQEFGYPYPSTYAGYWNRLDASVLHALADAGIAVDTALIPKVGRSIYTQDFDPEAKGRVLQDCSSRDRDDPASYRPSHPSYDDYAVPGDCPVLEVPVTFSYHGIETGIPAYINEIRKRWIARHEVRDDIIQFFWHPHEFIFPGTTTVNQPVIDAYIAIFSELVGWNDVVFSTMRDAARAFI